jgi:hypothetical protein
MHHFEVPESEAVREEGREDREEGAICALQCRDSLAVAANHIGEDPPGIKNLLARTRRVLRRSI